MGFKALLSPIRAFVRLVKAFFSLEGITFPPREDEPLGDGLPEIRSIPEIRG